MLSKIHRFVGPRSLKYVYQKGVSVRGPFFAIKTTVNPQRKTYRVAVVVSRKVHKSAVARNRLRRRIYEAVRELESEINQPYDIVITVFNDSLVNESSASLNRQLKKQLSSAGVFSESSSK